MPTLALTGAHGKTGRAIIAKATETWEVRALARSDEQRRLLESGGCDVVIGDMTDRGCLETLFDGVDAIYHICPNFHPGEVEIGSLVADAAVRVERLVYHSVLHPQIEAMPHHWRKLRVEELLLKGRPEHVSFLRPAPYVQNLAAYIEAALSHGELRMPYAVDTKIAMVDLADVATAAMVVLADDFEAGSGWDLCGVGAVSHREIADRLGSLAGRKIEAVEHPSSDDVPAEVRVMFGYMHTHCLPGSSGQLRALIGTPTSLDESLQRLVEGAREAEKG